MQENLHKHGLMQTAAGDSERRAVRSACVYLEAPVGPGLRRADCWANKALPGAVRQGWREGPTVLSEPRSLQVQKDKTNNDRHNRRAGSCLGPDPAIFSGLV